MQSLTRDPLACSTQRCARRVLLANPPPLPLASCLKSIPRRESLRMGSGISSSASSSLVCHASTSGRGFSEVQQGKKSDSMDAGKCPCGSNKPYKACCAPIHQGAWAQTAIDLALARVSGRLLGLTNFLADSTHPESLDAIGGRSRLELQALKQSRLFEMRQIEVLDFTSGPVELQDSGRSSVYTGSGDVWLVLMALEFTHGNTGVRDRLLWAENYLKKDGRWLYLGQPNQYPTNGPFTRMAEEYGQQQPGEDSQDDVDVVFEDAWQAKAGVQPNGREWPFKFDLATPSYALYGSAEDELLGPWLWDELSIEDTWGKASEGTPLGRGVSRRRELVYLDDYASVQSEQQQGAAASKEQQLLLYALTGEDSNDSEGLSVRRTAMLNSQLKRLRDPDLDMSTWMFRTGRFQRR